MDLASSLDQNLQIYNYFPEYVNADFIVGVDDFCEIEVNSTEISGFWYFKNRSRGLIKRFILERTKLIEKWCEVTLIKKPNGKFTPRFKFEIWNTTKKALETMSKSIIDENLIKARVDLNSCYENFLKLLNFIKEFQEIDFNSDHLSVIESKDKDIFEDLAKATAVEKFSKKYGADITEKDITLLQDRRSKLEHFKSLLTNKGYFESQKNSLGENKRDEDVWQDFFEKNQWIFGYGLQLISCEGLDDKKLEQTVVGNDLIDGNGKRIDALLKTRGSVSKILFCEIKTHHQNILIELYPSRPGVFVPAIELRGAVAQIQKTIHKVSLKLTQNYLKPSDSDGNPTGEEILFVRPRGIVVIGKLDDFITDAGINYEMLSSFELFRQQVKDIEIITYDELYQRVKFIVDQ